MTFSLIGGLPSQPTQEILRPDVLFSKRFLFRVGDSYITDEISVEFVLCNIPRPDSPRVKDTSANGLEVGRNTQKGGGSGKGRGRRGERCGGLFGDGKLLSFFSRTAVSWLSKSGDSDIESGGCCGGPVMTARKGEGGGANVRRNTTGSLYRTGGSEINEMNRARSRKGQKIWLTMLIFSSKLGAYAILHAHTPPSRSHSW